MIASVFDHRLVVMLFVTGFAFWGAGSVVADNAGMFVNVRNLGPEINTSAREWGATVSSDGLTLLFYSTRTDGFGDSDIWISTRNHPDDLFGQPENLGNTVNTDSYEGAGTLSADGLTMFFNSDRPGGSGEMDVYMATRQSAADPFENVLNLGDQINTPWRDAGPVLSEDELTLYFQSDRPGGVGDRDIYMATRQSTVDPFGNVVNLGEGVNSPFEETRGSISSDGLTYFFASNRPGGSGFHDIYYVTRSTTEEAFGNAENLGTPISSSTAEAAPTVSADWPAAGSKLYFVAWTSPGIPHRDGYGNLDLFEATWVPIPEPSAITLLAIGISGLLLCRIR